MRVTPRAPNVRYPAAVTDDDPPMLTVEEWLARRPSDAESVREEAEAFRHMSPAERLGWFVKLQKSMDAFVGLHPVRPRREDDDFWRRWRDPMYGRPR
jgi:hypothetical protein